MFCKVGGRAAAGPLVRADLEVTLSLEVVYGEPRHRALAKQLADTLRSTTSQGTVYLGYPVLATADERVYVDALLVSTEHGLVAFQISEVEPTDQAEWQEVIAEQDRLYSVLESHLGRHDSLRRGRRLAFAIETVTVFADPILAPGAQNGGHYCGITDVPALVSGFPSVDADIARALQAALQRVTTIKPTKRRSNVSRANSRGGVLKQIERGIANLDRWQKQAAIETPEGPQRIRGLAGSGKTIVLALKAAYLHAQHPDWRIAVTFQTRSLYQQFEDLVTRFTFEHSNDKPDFEKLQLLHAWGASNRDGVYKMIARSLGATFRDFAFALSTYGRDDAFAGVCRELLEIAAGRQVSPLFDAILIDEAQDLPIEFFRLAFRYTQEPKRIVWAFDELQNLSESAMPATDDLFGTGEDGEPLVNLQTREGEARKDITLPVCYRNSPWALTTAHALGFGIYRAEGLVQHFDDYALWDDIGYDVLKGSLAPRRKVELKRSPDSYPRYFPELLTSEDAVELHSFDTEVEQDAWVAQQIADNLSGDELEHDDLLVVLPDAYTSKRRASRFSQALARHDIQSHLAGVGSSVDELFISGSIAIAHIFRAKGNEAPMVYALDAQYAERTPNAVSRRNTLFTAITRSRAWVRICGWGPDMQPIAGEVEQVRSQGFVLAFTLPTEKKLAELRRIHRERSDAEVAALRRTEQSLEDLIAAFDRGEIDVQDLPPRMRTRLLALLRQESDGGADE